MAKIMGQDLELSKKEANLNKIKSRGVNINKAKTKKQEESLPVGPNMIDSLKEAFSKLIPEQSIGELGMILLIASGAFALAKLADTFASYLAPVIKFFVETLIPAFKELNADILSSPTGYLGVGGLVVTTTALLAKYGVTIKAFFSNIGKSITTALKSFKTMMLPKGYFINIRSGFAKIMGPLKRVGSFIATLTKTVGSGAATVLSKLPGVAAIGNFGKMFVRFLGPVGLVIQAFIGLFSGISRAIETFKSGGNIFEIIGSFMGGLYDSIVGATLNLLADIVGWVLKKIGLVSLGEFIQDLDFTVEGIGRGVGMVVEKIKGAFELFVDGLKTMANGIIKFINKIPGVNIPLFETKAIRESNELKKTADVEGDLENTNILAQASEGAENEKITYAKENFLSPDDDLLGQDVSLMKKKRQTLDNAIEVNRRDSMNKGGANINVVKGGNTSSNITNQTAVQSANVATDHSDSTAKSLASVAYA
jgi:hypothetical protein